MKKNEVIKNYTDVQLKNVDYQYNPDLTKALDHINGPFSYEDVFKITLWKVDRYPYIDKVTLATLNELETQKHFSEDVLLQILDTLLRVKGIGLHMA